MTDSHASPAPVTASAAGTPARRGNHPGIALAVIVTCTTMVVLDTTIVNVALPKIQGSLHFSTTNLSWVVNAYTLAFGGLLLFGGRVSDIFGRRRLFITGILLFTVASMVGGLATTAAWLIAARAAQGIGSAIALPCTLSLIVTNFQEGPERNRALSIYSSMGGAGGSLGILLGGLLTSWVSWRWVLFVNVPIGLVVASLAPLYVREPERNPGRIDLAGTLTSVGGMVCLVYAFIRVPSSSWTAPFTMGAFILGAALLATFVLIESRITQPIMPLWLLANRSRAGAYFNTLVLPAAMFGAFYFLSQFLQNVIGFSPITTGVAFLPMTVGMFASVRIMPLLVARFGAKPWMVMGIALAVVSCFWLSRLTPNTTYLTGLLVPMILLGLGIGVSFMPMNATILSGVPRTDAGSASGLLQALQQVGAALGLAVLVTVFGTTTRHAAPPTAGANPAVSAHQALAHGIQNSFAVVTVFLAVCLLVALFVIRAPRPTRD